MFTRNILIRLIAVLLFLYVHTPAHGWNDRGHMMIAAIAYQELTKENQEFITDILMHHPEYQRSWKLAYQKVKEDAELGLYLFMRASVWADEIKSDQHPAHQYDAPKWHYINYELRFPFDGVVRVSDDENAVQAVELNVEIFNSESTSKHDKAIALSWLIHMVGDLHQPLHTSSLFSDQFPRGDKGGNLFWVKANGKVKLHSYWDGLFGKSTKIRSILNEGELIKSAYKEEIGVLANEPASTWSVEIFKLAREKVYLNGALDGSSSKKNAPQLPVNYGEDSKVVAEQQVYLAGYRLLYLISQ